jgi:molecular chaperone GrpE
MDERENMESRQEYCDPEENFESSEESVSSESETSSRRMEQDRLENALRRAQADLVNYRNRMEAERADLLKYGNQRLLGRLLPILDELTLALQQPSDGASSDSWLEGFHLINRKLNALLELEGVEPIEALGKPFDPSEHEALAQQQTSDKEDGEVLMVVRNGYKLHNRLLRPAQVVVAANDGAPSAQPDSDSVSHT